MLEFAAQYEPVLGLLSLAVAVAAGLWAIRVAARREPLVFGVDGRTLPKKRTVPAVWLGLAQASFIFVPVSFLLLGGLIFFYVLVFAILACAMTLARMESLTRRSIAQSWAQWLFVLGLLGVALPSNGAGSPALLPVRLLAVIALAGVVLLAWLGPLPWLGPMRRSRQLGPALPVTAAAVVAASACALLVPDVGLPIAFVVLVIPLVVWVSDSASNLPSHSPRRRPAGLALVAGVFGIVGVVNVVNSQRPTPAAIADWVESTAWAPGDMWADGCKRVDWGQCARWLQAEGVPVDLSRHRASAIAGLSAMRPAELAFVIRMGWVDASVAAAHTWDSATLRHALWPETGTPSPGVVPSDDQEWRLELLAMNGDLTEAERGVLRESLRAAAETRSKSGELPQFERLDLLRRLGEPDEPWLRATAFAILRAPESVRDQWPQRGVSLGSVELMRIYGIPDGANPIELRALLLGEARGESARSRVGEGRSMVASAGLMVLDSVPGSKPTPWDYWSYDRGVLAILAAVLLCVLAVVRSPRIDDEDERAEPARRAAATPVDWRSLILGGPWPRVRRPARVEPSAGPPVGRSAEWVILVRARSHAECGLVASLLREAGVPVLADDANDPIAVQAVDSYDVLVSPSHLAEAKRVLEQARSEAFAAADADEA